VDLHELLEADLACLFHEGLEPAGRMECGEQEDEVCPCLAQERELPRIDDEILRQDGQGDGRADRPQVVERATEPVGLDDDGDGRRSSGFVGPRTGRDVQGATWQLTGGGGSALHLRDQVKARGSESMQQVTRRSSGRGGVRQTREARPGQLLPEIGAASPGDLRKDIL
jgi:hypothetical protein